VINFGFGAWKGAPSAPLRSWIEKPLPAGGQGFAVVEVASGLSNPRLSIGDEVLIHIRTTTGSGVRG
jgi:hypothetical protein